MAWLLVMGLLGLPSASGAHEGAAFDLAALASSIDVRVNAGGPQLSATPAWTADTTTSPSPYVNATQTGNKIFSTTAPIDLSHPSLPAGTPQALFQTERWDPPESPKMKWSVPVAPGGYEVRLYFAEIFDKAQAVGARVFDVSIEGKVVLDDYDVFADVGANKGVMKSFQVSSDSTLTVDLAHVKNNPAIKGIEIVPATTSPGVLSPDPPSIQFGSTVIGASKSTSVTVANAGGAGDPNIVVDATTISGGDAAMFSDGFNDGADVVLVPGQSTTFNVTFSPTGAGAKWATLKVAHSGADPPLSVPLSGQGLSDVPVGFGKSLLVNESSNMPTSLQFGPDGRLYVAQFDGTIKVYTVARNGPNDYAVIATQTITSIKSIPNHDDNGVVNTTSGVAGTRLVTGLLVTGTAANPIVYVTSSDPRIGGGPSKGDLNLDTNSSMLSRLTWNGSSWTKLDLVRGLPRSEENHASNGMELDEATNTLFIAHGGNTNQGATSNNFAFLPEFALSAAVLSVDLDAIGNTTYDIPTLNDEDRAGVTDANDPFGGNDGKNQAKIVPGGPVQVYAPGFRNPYDLLFTESGKMYTIDNGANAGWGNIPINEGPSGTCTNAINEPGTTDPDSLHLITGPGYYGGHPNPTRGNKANIFNASNPQSPVPTANPVECDYRKPTSNATTALTTFASSTNGLDEYTTSNLGGQMTGDLLAAGYQKNEVYRVRLNDAGTQVTSNAVLFSSIQTPLDIVATGDDEPFPGTLWVAGFSSGNIVVFEPNDFGSSTPAPNCSGTFDPDLDEDDDGYSNSDEIDSGTDPCSRADVPNDWDDDKTSNLNDPDDDNDGSPDTSDPFAIDPANGLATTIPVEYTWENDAPDPGGLVGLGFTGLMTNHSSNYEALFDDSKLTAGGAAGVLTVDEVSEGDALGPANSQEYGFQFGVDARPASTGPFVARTRILAPFAGVVPQDGQSMGLFIGDGTQDGYVKIVADAGGGVGAITALKEDAGKVSDVRAAVQPMPSPQYVDLFLRVDPASGTVQPRYSVTTAGATGPVTDLGGPISVPTAWFTSPTGLAVGIISTSAGPAIEFPATWDFISIQLENPSPSTAVARDGFDRSVQSGWGQAEVGGAWQVSLGPISAFGVGGGEGNVVTPGGRIDRIVHLPGVSARDVDAVTRIGFPRIPPASNFYYSYLLLRQDSGTYYRVGLYVDAQGKIFIRTQTHAGKYLIPDVATGMTMGTGDSFMLRVQVQGTSPTSVKAKAWKTGTTEPSSWALTTTDAETGLQDAGSIGVRTLNTTGSAATFRFDDLVVSPL